MYITNKMHKIFVIRPYFQYTLYMFRTVSVRLQEQSFYKLYVVFGMCGYVWLLCCSVYLQEQPFYKLYVIFGTCGYDIQRIKRLLLKMD